MQRAGVFIGVNRTGHLQVLADACASARRFHEWALSQGMKDGSAAVLITDEDGPVTASRIQDAIEHVIDTAAPEQLIVYFAGHGVVLHKSEQWLLSRAPERPGEAIDVVMSVTHAKYGTTPHVVFISDACRAAPDGLQAQAVQGVSAFPNTDGSDHQPVDAFYACSLGKVAAELKTQDDGAVSYRAVYTEVLLDALQGAFRAGVTQRDGDGAWYVDLRPLRDVLTAEVPARIRARKLTAHYHQIPRADIYSDPGAWVSRLQALPAEPPAPSPPSGPGPRYGFGTDGPATSFGDDQGYTDGEAAALRPPPDQADFDRTVARVSEKFGPEAFETQCGFKVSGAAIVEAFAPSSAAEILDGGASMRISPPGRGGSVVLRFDNGRVAVLPALAEFIGALVIEDGELISLAYEPVAGSRRMDVYAGRAGKLRELRALAAASSLHGRYSLDVRDPLDAASGMQRIKGMDPTLAIYAAYAYADRSATERIGRMSDWLRADVGVTFFDLELLCRRLTGRQVEPDGAVLPAVPLLSQGWSIARAHGTRWPRPLEGVERLAVESLWSLFEAPAFDLFAESLSQGAMR